MATGRLPDPNTAPLTAKGDLYTYSTVPARLAVGSNGDTLVADSSASTGLRWQGNFAAGKNKVINGAFDVWQRGTSFTLPSTFSYTFTADRFDCFSTSAGTTVSRQTFTPGTAPVAGYEAQYFFRYYTADTSVGHIIRHKIEDVRTFAGQTITISFWAKAASNLSFSTYNAIVQNFGSGGSGDVSTGFTVSPSTITTSWQRFTATVTVPGVSGKTIGAGSFCNVQLGMAGNNTLDIWGIQAEAGSVATAFQTATGTLAGEFEACARYYYRATGTQAYTCLSHLGSAETTTLIRFTLPVPTQMRVAPTSVDFSTLTSSRDGLNTGNAVSAIALSAYSGKDAIQLAATVTGATQYSPYYIYTNNSAAGFIGVSAEL